MKEDSFGKEKTENDDSGKEKTQKGQTSTGKGTSEERQFWKGNIWKMTLLDGKNEKQHFWKTI